MQNAIGLNGKPVPELGTSVREPDIIHMQDAYSIAPGLLDAEVGRRRIGNEIGAMVCSDVQSIGKAVDYP